MDIVYRLKGIEFEWDEGKAEAKRSQTWRHL